MWTMMEADVMIGGETAGLPLDCKAGCEWCCHQLVVLTCAADGEAILETARERMGDGEFEGFVQQVRDQASAIHSLPHVEAEKRRWPCPLLRDGRCVVYEVRPVACRSVFSTDSRCCRAMFECRTFGELPAAYRRMAMDISQKAIRLQVMINNNRPIDAPMELRSLLWSLLEKNTVKLNR